MKNVLITGGASGLGKTLCKAFKENGYNVIFTYHNTIPTDMDGMYKIKCDLASEEDINNAQEEIITKFGYIDVLVNNAAVEKNKEFDIKTKEDFMYTLEVNLVGTFLLTRKIGNEMYARRKGKIINISSNNALGKYDPVTLEYDASKNALISLTYNLAKQYAPYVNVNAIAPGWIKTKKVIEQDEYLGGNLIKEESKKILLNRFAEEEDIANLVLFLASDKANYINSEVIKIDGGSY